MCDIMFTVHVCVLSFTSGGGGDMSVVTENEAARRGEDSLCLHSGICHRTPLARET